MKRTCLILLPTEPSPDAIVSVRPAGGRRGVFTLDGRKVRQGDRLKRGFTLWMED